MKSKTTIISAVIHVVVFGAALQYSQGRSTRRATSIAIVGEKKKKAEPKKEEKPRPKLASARPEVVQKTNAAPKLAPSAEAPTPAAVETNVEMSNDDGPGIAIGGPAPPPSTNKPAAAAPAQAAPAVKKEKAIVPKDNPVEDECTEAPSKPVPVQRASEIEYTQEARANGVEGRLVLKITVGSDGSVLSVTVVSSVDPQLDAAAIAAVKTWVFKPSMRCGRAMAGGVFTLAQRFELGD